MRVLLVHEHDYGTGGGNIAMCRLHDAFEGAGVASQILCRRKSSLHRKDGRDGLESVEIPRSGLVGKVEGTLRRVTHPLGLNDLHAISSFRVKKLPAYRKADLIDFHCIHGGFFNYLALPGLTRDKPAVLTLHDMWPFTGHCHASLECDRWEEGCGPCPHPEIAPEIRRDATRIEWHLKRWVYRNSRFVVVTPSRWMAAVAKRSILARFPIFWIPHGLDLEVFQPLDKQQARRVLGIPPDRLVLLFSSPDFSRPLKGADVLARALNAIPRTLRSQLCLLLMGRNGHLVAENLEVESINLGYVPAERIRAEVYSAADLLLHPSVAESFGLTIMEGIACATPVVAARAGGVVDLVRENSTGLLADPGDPFALRDRIVELLEDPKRRNALRLQCRAVAEQEYDIRLQVERYLAVYRYAIEWSEGVVKRIGPSRVMPELPEASEISEASAG